MSSERINVLLFLQEVARILDEEFSLEGAFQSLCTDYAKRYVSGGISEKGFVHRMEGVIRFELNADYVELFRSDILPVPEKCAYVLSYIALLQHDNESNPHNWKVCPFYLSLLKETYLVAFLYLSENRGDIPTLLQGLEEDQSSAEEQCPSRALGSNEETSVDDEEVSTSGIVSAQEGNSLSVVWSLVMQNPENIIALSDIITSLPVEERLERIEHFQQAALERAWSIEPSEILIAELISDEERSGNGAYDRASCLH